MIVQVPATKLLAEEVVHVAKFQWCAPGLVTKHKVLLEVATYMELSRSGFGCPHFGDPDFLMPCCHDGRIVRSRGQQ